MDAAGDLFIADPSTRVREVKLGPDGLLSDGTITTVAGDGKAGYSGDGGAGDLRRRLDKPYGVAVDAAGDLFISDAGHSVVREVVAATGDIITVAGDGKSGYSGDGGPATSAELNQPEGVAVDPAGDLFIADFLQQCSPGVLAGSNGDHWLVDLTANAVHHLAQPRGHRLRHGTGRGQLDASPMSRGSSPIRPPWARSSMQATTRRCPSVSRPPTRPTTPPSPPRRASTSSRRHRPSPGPTPPDISDTHGPAHTQLDATASWIVAVP